MSTADHPQTDGQSENTNKILEDTLRAYVSPFQDDWDEHLVPAEFAHNDSVHASTGFTPFYMMHGKHPYTPLTLFLQPLQPETSQTVEQFAERLRQDIEHARHSMYAAQQRQKFYADKSRRDLHFKVGDKVWLSASHLRNLPQSLTGTPKLRPRYYGPYEVLEVIGQHQLAYKLKLPPRLTIHPVIHISHLIACYGCLQCRGYLQNGCYALIGIVCPAQYIFVSYLLHRCLGLF